MFMRIYIFLRAYIILLYKSIDIRGFLEHINPNPNYNIM